MSDDMYKILLALKQPDVIAIVLGGSYCIGLQNDASDIDICIYYENDINISRLNKELSQIDDEHASTILLPLNSWGIWQNSGGVCLINGKEYDITLRNIIFIEQVIKEVIQGRIYCIHNPAYPFGYCNSYIIGEIDNCQILFFSSNKLKHLKQQIIINKKYICQAIIQFFIENAIFQCICAFKGEFANDLSYKNASIINCAFSLLNVYAAKKKILLFHNKRIDQRILDAYCNDKSFFLLNNVQFILNIFSGKIHDSETICKDLGNLIVYEVERNFTLQNKSCNYILLKSLINHH